MLIRTSMQNNLHRVITVSTQQ